MNFSSFLFIKKHFFEKAWYSRVVPGLVMTIGQWWRRTKCYPTWKTLKLKSWAKLSSGCHLIGDSLICDQWSRISIRQLIRLNWSSLYCLILISVGDSVIAITTSTQRISSQTLHSIGSKHWIIVRMIQINRFNGLRF